jgi:hypothetical protein
MCNSIHPGEELAKNSFFRLKSHPLKVFLPKDRYTSSERVSL